MFCVGLNDGYCLKALSRYIQVQSGAKSKWKELLEAGSEVSGKKVKGGGVSRVCELAEFGAKRVGMLNKQARMNGCLEVCRFVGFRFKHK